MACHDSLRWRLLGAIASGALLGTGCGGSTSDDRTQTPSPVNPSPTNPNPTPNPTPEPTACSGSVEQSCYTREQMENQIRHGNGQLLLDPPRSDAEVAAAFLPNGCAKQELIADGCCNDAMGPGTPNGGECCYQHCTGACCGRPLLVDGSARVAPAAHRGDWLSADDERPLAEREPEVAAAYLEDALLEHASVAAFARFTLELLAIGAPPVFVAEAQRAALDEIEHARACFALSSRFGGSDVGPGPLDLRGLQLASELSAIVENVVLEGCVGETIGAAVVAAQLEGAEDPEVRAVLARIAEDERRHAELAWRFVAWAVQSGGVAVRRSVERAMRAALQHDLPAARLRMEATADWRRLGRLTAAERSALERDVREQVLTPAFAALLAEPAPRATSPTAAA